MLIFFLRRGLTAVYPELYNRIMFNVHAAHGNHGRETTMTTTDALAIIQSAIAPAIDTSRNSYARTA